MSKLGFYFRSVGTRINSTVSFSSWYCPVREWKSHSNYPWTFVFITFRLFTIDSSVRLIKDFWQQNNCWLNSGKLWIWTKVYTFNLKFTYFQCIRFVDKGAPDRTLGTSLVFFNLWYADTWRHASIQQVVFGTWKCDFECILALFWA